MKDTRGEELETYRIEAVLDVDGETKNDAMQKFLDSVEGRVLTIAARGKERANFDDH